ncbi:hypothetical protein GCM10023319_02120 [Nocardia iowensis]
MPTHPDNREMRDARSYDRIGRPAALSEARAGIVSHVPAPRFPWCRTGFVT